MTSLVWFRDDLRLADHSALDAASRTPGGIVALYVLEHESSRPIGAAARWWLHQSLTQLRASLAERGIPLILRSVAAETVLPAVATECRATHVFWNRRYGPERHIDARIKGALTASGIAAHSFHGGLLFDPRMITTGSGTPFRVYTPFWRACLEAPAPARPLPVPGSLAAAPQQPRSEELCSWDLQPASPNWAAEIAQRWRPGEAAAAARLREFLDEDAARYAANRDIPSATHGSELSPHLRFGEISPRTVWHEALGSGADVGTFLSELGWREFAWHTTFHNGALHEQGLDARFDHFPWRHDGGADTAAWRMGETGFGIVDAGMCELWRTGFMHNRVRMITASFLVKNLLVDWRIGEAWFWDTLVDADAASNPFNWQWVAGCGADAAPYFRIFNPLTQQQKFDPAGSYVTRWAPDSVLHPPLVDLRESRARALAGFESIRGLPRAAAR